MSSIFDRCTVACIALFVFANSFAQDLPDKTNNKRFAQLTHADTTMVHDPVIVRQDSIYYLFATGWGIDMLSSDDMVHWKREKPVFDHAPQWAVDTIPNFKGHIWAPDIFFHNGQYHLYYSVSAFGKNTSAIGVATNPTLHPNSPNYKWTDHGAVIHSTPQVTNWNAIDPNIVADKKGDIYMSFGSFWDGIKMAKLSSDGLSITNDLTELPTIATRKRGANLKGNLPQGAADNAIEAPFIFEKGNYYYLFVSLDYCCKGLESTYKIAVGRSKNVTGPYIDEDGVPLTQGGGTVLRQGDNKYSGIGHNAVASFNGTDYLISHAYSKAHKGRSMLSIEKLIWDKGWPSVSKTYEGGER